MPYSMLNNATGNCAEICDIMQGTKGSTALGFWYFASLIDYQKYSVRGHKFPFSSKCRDET